MKLATSLSSKLHSLSPKHLFRSKSKSKSSISRSSNPPSFTSVTSSSSSDGYEILKSDPISVLPSDRELLHGVVSREDLVSLLTKLSSKPPSEEEVNLILDDDSISLEELASRVAGTSNEGLVETEEDMREVFEFFDADRDGKITAEELYRVFEVIGDERCTIEECRRMIATVDLNGDGFVCFEDFTRMMEIQ